MQVVRAVARVPLRGGFVADREVADSGLRPSLGFVGPPHYAFLAGGQFHSDKPNKVPAAPLSIK